MKKGSISFLLIALLIGSCAPVTASPTQPPAATQTVVPSATPVPTQTAIPTATPRIQGPYLLVAHYSNLTIMDTDGNERKQIQLPNNGYTIALEEAVSPDGNWLAYFTGSTKEPYDIALNLFNLSDETSQTIAHLIAPGYPENLRPIAETLDLSHYHPSVIA